VLAARDATAHALAREVTERRASRATSRLSASDGSARASAGATSVLEEPRPAKSGERRHAAESRALSDERECRRPRSSG